ncbi:MAG: Holliday junction resolvase RuvX [Candidatus Aphodocola sp.]
MKYLGLDLGSKTLGIATSDFTETIATTLKTLYFKDENYDSLLEPLEEIISENKIDKIVLGFPKNMDNTIGQRAEITLDFKEKLEKKFQIEVILEDERLTSVISNQVLIAADLSRKKRKKKVDGVAAVLILQSYLDRKKIVNKEER